MYVAAHRTRTTPAHTLIVTRHTDLVRDILFKFSMDSRGLYQSDDAAAKLAGTR